MMFFQNKQNTKSHEAQAANYKKTNEVFSPREINSGETHVIHLAYQKISFDSCPLMCQENITHQFSVYEYTRLIFFENMCTFNPEG